MKVTPVARRMHSEPDENEFTRNVVPRNGARSALESAAEPTREPEFPTSYEPEFDVQREPFSIPSASGSSTLFKVDLAYPFQEHVLICGWSAAEVRLGILRDNRVVPCERISVPRPDVAAATGGSPADLGFALVVDASGDGMPTLVCDDGEGSYGFQLVADTKERLAECTSMLRPVLHEVAKQLEAFSHDWRELVTLFPPLGGACMEVAGYVEASAVCITTGKGVAVGWETHDTDTTVWLQTRGGHVHRVDNAFRMFRNDVHDAVSAEHAHDTAGSGFVAAVEDCSPADTISLLALTPDGVRLVSSRTVDRLSDAPVQTAKWLFGIATPQRLLAERFEKVDIRVMDPLLLNKAVRESRITVTPVEVGAQLKAPKASVVVPLYGRWDFVEHQLMEFCSDTWFLKNTQLIYVIDDPQLKEPFLSAVHNLHALYRVPFVVVPGEVNRGFSGANNLGAKYARGEFLVFLNSDVFPASPGWVQELIAPLQGRTNYGVAGGKLLYADGSIQHAGINFKRREDFGIWTNHHPMMGLAPDLDRSTSVTERPAVTGACFAMRRSDFDAVGGWDTGYLIGDFEDSDLCFKVRRLGQKIAYVPSACLTHLERQSFKLLGSDDFRQRVVLYNAARHQKRWAIFLDKEAAS